jgi:hypothetical protein
VKVVSKKLRDSARGQSCTLRIAPCASDETVVLCHLPVKGFGGVGMKVPDNLAVFGCDNCHAVLDGRAKGEYSATDMLRALGETQMYWIESGLIKVAGVAC